MKNPGKVYGVTPAKPDIFELAINLTAAHAMHTIMMIMMCNAFFFRLGKKRYR